MRKPRFALFLFALAGCAQLLLAGLATAQPPSGPLSQTRTPPPAARSGAEQPTQPLAAQAQVRTEAARGPLRVVVPSEVALGDPFVVTVLTDAPCDRLSAAWLGKTLEFAPEREARGARTEILLGAGLGTSPGDYAVTVEGAFAGRRETVLARVRVVDKAFPEQRLTLPKGMVTPSPEVQERIKREQAEIAAALAQVSPARLWTLPLVRPVPGETSSAFGLRRVLNGQPRAPHRGLDYRAPLGQPVACLSPGRVLLTGDYYFNGRCVFVDHGQGVVSMYFHLSRVDVSRGQTVAAGQTVGLVGATGRATGPHLHLGLNVLGQAVDPSPLMRPVR